MNCLLLIGPPQMRDSYINELILREKVASFNTFIAEGKFGIKEAKAYIKQLSFKKGEGQKRVFIVPDQITIQAQNALLKTVEELDESEIVIFTSSSGEQILETIKSRCSTVFLRGESESIVGSGKVELVRNYINAKGRMRLYFAQKIAEEFSTDNSQELLDSLLQIFSSVITEKKDLDSSNLEVIEKLLDDYPLVKNNNLNKQFYIEMALMQKLSA